jgi:hypothetical protein
MRIVFFAIVLIAALFAIGSGVWVATALVRALSRHKTTQNTCHPANDKSNHEDI